MLSCIVMYCVVCVLDFVFVFVAIALLTGGFGYCCLLVMLLLCLCLILLECRVFVVWVIYCLMLLTFVVGYRCFMLILFGFCWVMWRRDYFWFVCCFCLVGAFRFGWVVLDVVVF